MTTIERDPAEAPMRFGVCIPNFRPGASPEGMLAATQTAERLGWHSAWTTDHVLVDSAKRGVDYRHIYEAVNTLAWLGGQTSSIRLGMSVLVVPMRNAVVMAKELATLDALTGGRLIVGVGIGWNRTEFANLGLADRFGHRGDFLEETVKLWRHLWGGGTGPYRGRYDGYEEGFFSPLPPQGADLPIWVGATAETALQRAGRMAQGYQSTGTDADGMRQRAAVIRSAAEAAGRPMPTLSSRLQSRRLGTSPEQQVAAVRSFRDAGVSVLALDFRETDPEKTARAIETFDREVASAI